MHLVLASNIPIEQSSSYVQCETYPFCRRTPKEACKFESINKTVGLTNKLIVFCRLSPL